MKIDPPAQPRLPRGRKYAIAAWVTLMAALAIVALNRHAIGETLMLPFYWAFGWPT